MPFILAHFLFNLQICFSHYKLVWFKAVWLQIDNLRQENISHQEKYFAWWSGPLYFVQCSSRFPNLQEDNQAFFDSGKVRACYLKVKQNQLINWLENMSRLCFALDLNLINGIIPLQSQGRHSCRTGEMLKEKEKRKEKKKGENKTDTSRFNETKCILSHFTQDILATLWSPWQLIV